jgi:hypothetical protein
MRRALIAVIFAGCACAQSVVDASHLEATLKDFAPHAGDVQLRCELAPAAPILDFAFRFRAGYTFRLPSGQFQTANHNWFVLTKITPQDDAQKPVYLFARTSAADVVKTDLNLEVSGVFLLGEGQYSAEATIYDDGSHTCKREWQILAARTHAERAVPLSLAPFTVRDLPGFRASDWVRTAVSNSTAQSPRVQTYEHSVPSLTVLLNAAPLSPRRTRLRPADRNLLLSALASIVGRVPAASVRLVVFSLEAQKELLRSDHFSVSGLSQAVRAIDSLELQTVDVKVLQNPTGHVDLLTALINKEVQAAAPGGAVVVLGPLSRFDDRVPEGSLEKRPGGARVFYVQYRPALRRPPPIDPNVDDVTVPHGRPPAASSGTGSQSGSTGATGTSTSGTSTGSTSGGSSSASSRPPMGSDPTDPSGNNSSRSGSSTGGGGAGRSGRIGPPPTAPMPTGQHETDVINAAVARLKGRTIVVHTPEELAKAITQLQRGK